MNTPLPELEALIATAKSLFARGYSFGTAGNISIRLGDSVYATPTGSSFQNLSSGDLAVCDLHGNVLGPNKPTKELPFHLAVYRARRRAGAVVHLHSTYATAIACLRIVDMDDALPALTPYYAMRVPALPVVPYLPPGDPQLGAHVEKLAARTSAMLMRNHGSITIGTTLAEAAALAEEIEEAARLYLLLGDRAQPLSAEQITELRWRFS